MLLFFLPVSSGPQVPTLVVTCTPAFQAGAFQFDAFQECSLGKKKVGWFDEWDTGRHRLRHDPEELERRLAQQRSNTFGRKWYEDYLDAQEAALARSKKVKSEKHAAALREAVADAAALEFVEEAYVSHLTEALNAAANASRSATSIRHAERMVLFVRRMLEEIEDEEEALMMLLH